MNLLDRKYSLALSNLAQLHENHTQSIKSCGEGKISALNDELELSSNYVSGRHYSNPPKTETRNVRLDDMQNNLDSDEDNFKCGTRCFVLVNLCEGKISDIKKTMNPRCYI